MDSFDPYYQQSDSKALLDEHGATLVAEARQILGPHPEARLAGAIVMQDSREAPPFREALAKLTGQPVPEGLLVGICPRQMIEALLTANVAPEHWREEPWQPQQTLPVVVVTRDGFRFGFFPIHATNTQAHDDTEA